jgi:tetratricopeptide (TPR) repeat protein
MRIRGASLLAALLAALACGAGGKGDAKLDKRLEAAQQAFEQSDYARAVEILQAEAAQNPQNAEIPLLLAKTYYELQQHDGAVAWAEKAVALAPQNSVHHEWLGRTYGEKAQHSSWLSAISLARKARAEFELAVYLDGNNFSARQALIEFDCSAPSLVGGGEDKARPEIAEVAALDAAEGHFAAGNCRRQKRDFAAASAEFTKALESGPKSADLIYDIGDYALKHGEPGRLLEVADEGELVRPSDPRGKFFRAVGWILLKEEPDKSEQLLKQYLKVAPIRMDYPKLGEAHYWLGRLLESQKDMRAAEVEYRTAVRLDPKNKNASVALKKLGES